MVRLFAVLQAVNTLIIMGIGLAIIWGLISILVRRLRRNFSTYLLLLSYAMGFSTWIFSAVVVYYLWHLFGLLIGLFLAGVGVVPLALCALLFHGEWKQMLSILASLLLIYGCRYVSVVVAAKDTKRREDESFIKLIEEAPDEEWHKYIQ